MTGRGQCDADWLGQCLTADEEDQDASGPVVRGQLVLVDCRSANDFGNAHINGAVSLSLPTLIQRRLLKGNLAMPVALGYCSPNDSGAKVTDEQWRSNLIVLYDESSTTSQLTRNDDVATCTSSKMAAILLDHLRRDGYRACLLQGGLRQFKAKYPHLCTDISNGDLENSLQRGFHNLHLTSAPMEQSEESVGVGEGGTTFPVEVLPHLFLGDAKNASDLKCLEGNGIKYILNVTPNVPNKFETNDQFKYLQIPIRDHWSQNLTTYFPQAITFIEEGRRSNYGVLVHCLAGISRSVTVTVAYLMYSMSLSLNDAYDYVKRRKPNVSPNLTFMGQLLDFENVLKNDRRPCLCQCHSSSSSSSFSSSSSSFSSFSSSFSNSFSASSGFSSLSSASRSPSAEYADDTGSCQSEVICSSCSCAVTATTSSSSSSATTTSSLPFQKSEKLDEHL